MGAGTFLERRLSRFSLPVSQAALSCAGTERLPEGVFWGVGVGFLGLFLGNPECAVDLLVAWPHSRSECFLWP